MTCHVGCTGTCGHHPVERLTTQQCYDRAAPLGYNDFRVLARTFGFCDGFDLQRFAIFQQHKADRVYRNTIADIDMNGHIT